MGHHQREPQVIDLIVFALQILLVASGIVGGFIAERLLFRAVARVWPGLAQFDWKD